MSAEVNWLAAFADVPGPRFDDALAFWSAVTGWAPGEAHGQHGEFVPLEPRDGDGCLWLQRTDTGSGGWHPDLLVPDPATAALAAVALGARVVRNDDLLVVLASPQGQPFCFFLDDAAGREQPPASTWPQSGRSLADQLCLDIPFDAYDGECGFWAELTGWPHLPAELPEFSRLTRPPTLAIQLLLQRLGRDDSRGTRAHLDLSADDPQAEVARHAALGAEVTHVAEGWTTLRDPAGLTYCVTHRRPRES